MNISLNLCILFPLVKFKSVVITHLCESKFNMSSNEVKRNISLDLIVLLSVRWEFMLRNLREPKGDKVLHKTTLISLIFVLETTQVLLLLITLF